MERAQIIIRLLRKNVFAGGAVALLSISSVWAGTCGNNITEPGEACDGTDLNGYFCNTVAAGFTGGTLGCKPDCTTYEISQCQSDGKTIQATSCNQVDVQNAINIAADGDRVLIPEGNCSWSDDGASIGVNIPGKSIILQGAGIDKTIITANGGFQSSAISVSGAEGKPWRITGFTLKRGPNFPDTDSRLMGIGGYGTNWRVDHMQFEGKWGLQVPGDNNSYVHNIDFAIGTVTEGYGLIDHCKLLGNAGINIMGDPYSIPDNDPRRSWKRPLSLGTEKAVYIEDNYSNMFHLGVENSGTGTDAYIGGRYVYRYNTGRTYVDNHPGTFSYEYYENELTNTPNTWWPLTLRGGTGVVFNNRFHDYNAKNINLRNDRSWPSKGLPCNGSDPVDGNQVEDSGAHSGGRQQTRLNVPGKNWEADFWKSCTVRNTTDGSWGRVDSNTGNTLIATLTSGNDNGWDTGDKYTLSCGYPCYAQIGRATDFSLTGINPQAFEPVYEWGNVVDGDDIDMIPFGEEFQNKHHLKENRDFINDTPRPGYVPYVYPHPLVNLVPTVGDVSDDGAVCGNGNVEDGLSQVRDVIVVDNVDPGCVLTGVWRPLAWPYPFNGLDFAFAVSADAAATYTPDFPVGGIYQVFVQKMAVDILVHHKNGDTVVDPADIRASGPWFYLGEFEFEAGTTGFVELHADVDTGTGFDAVMFARVGTGEECDDGNTANGDGCNSQCLVEVPGQVYTLAVTKSGTGGGTVQSTPAGINCGPDCSEIFEPNTPVKLVATAAPGSFFKGWSGTCSGLFQECTVTMSASRSAIARFDIDAAPEIYQQPQSATAVNGQAGGFYLLARGSGELKYQWKKENAPAIDPYLQPGSTGYYFTNATVTPADAGTYWCEVTNHVGTTNSVKVTLTVIESPPKITLQPEDTFVYPGAAATFSIGAEGSGPLIYQWQRNGKNIPGATGELRTYQPRTYTTFATTLADSGTVFHCIVSNSQGSVHSSSATLIVGVNPNGPAIVSQPRSVTVVAGEAATFSVTAQGNGPLSYQWLKNDTLEIPDATTSVYTIPVTELNDNGSTYSCVVGNAISSVTSNAALLTIRVLGPTALPENGISFLPFDNMFDPTTGALTIRYYVDGADDLIPPSVSLTVYDRMGQKVASLDRGSSIAPGAFETRWSGANSKDFTVSSGIYIVVLESGGHSVKQKVVVAK